MTNLHLNEQSIARFVPSPTPSTTRLDHHHHHNAIMQNHHQQHHHNTMPNNNISLNHASNHLLANQQTDVSLAHYTNNNNTPSPRSLGSQVAPPNPPPVNATRVLQRNLMYVVGLPSSLAKEEILKRKDYFGKYGKIVKIAISKKTVNNKDGGNIGMGGGERALYSAYVTFKRPEDCSAAIRQINGCQLGGVIVRATYGTNKYCSFWLKGQQCNNGSCLYLHSSASDQECCSKEDLLLMDKLAKISVFIEPDDLMHGRPAINRFIRSLTPQQLIAFVQLGQSINIYQLNYLQFIIPLLAEIAKLEPDIIRLQAAQTRNNNAQTQQAFNATPYPSHHNSNANNTNSPNPNSSMMVGVNGGQMNHSYSSVGSQQRNVTAPPGFNHNLSSIEAIGMTNNGMSNNNERLSPYQDAPLPASSSWSSGHNQNYPYAQRTSIDAHRSPPSPPPAIGRRTNPTSAPTSASNTPYYSHLDYPRNAHYDHNTTNNHSNNYPSSHNSNQEYERPQLSLMEMYKNHMKGLQYFQEKEESSVPHHQHTQSVYAQSSSAMANTDRSFNSNTTTNPIAINPRRATYPYPNGVSLLNENLVVDDDSERYSNISDTNSNSSGPAPSSSSFSSTPSVSPYTNSSLSSLFQNFHLNQSEQEREREKRASDSYSLFASSAPSSTSHSPSRIIQKSVSPLSVGSGQGPVNGASLMLPPSLTSLNPHHHHRSEESHLINMQLNHNNTISATLSLNAPNMSKEEENKLKQFHDEWAQQDEKNKSMNNNVINSKHDYFSVFQSASSPVIRSATSNRGSTILNNNNNHSNSNHNTPLISYSQRMHATALHEQYQHQSVAKSNDHSLDASLSSIFNNVQF